MPGPVSPRPWPTATAWSASWVPAAWLHRRSGGLPVKRSTMADARARLTAALSDRYRLERELGQGGMATVYLAEDLKHDRKVAIKVLKPELAAVLGAARFVQEIKTTAALQHPHILPLFDSRPASPRRGEGDRGCGFPLLRDGVRRGGNAPGEVES